MASAAPDVFVSYNRADRGWAEWIAWALEEAGYSVVVQAWDFRPGGNFVLYMNEAARARHTIAVLSPSYLAAEYTQAEWAAAFAGDPRGTGRRLMPVRVGECALDGLLAQIIYIDLVGLDEEEARRELLAGFAERGKPPAAPAFPGGAAVAAPPRAKPEFPSAPRISKSRLPITGETFVAREGELARLDDAWPGGTNAISFVANGGAGKSALVNHWLRRLQEDKWRGAQRVLGWSFYSQGTKATGASSEAFTEYALGWFAEELRGHGLALTLLGTYLHEVLEGDVRRRREAVVLDPANEGGEHARHVMDAYERWLGPGTALRALSLLGLFDRPAEAKAVAALRAAPVIPGLTEKIWVGEEREWQLGLSRLRQARLVAPAGGGGGGDGALDAHPLVREHFGERLRQVAPKAWRAGNDRLYDHYRRAKPEYPETLEEMLRLYAAVVHGCRAGREQEAYDEVYWRRILRGEKFFSLHKLGAFGAELTALAAFFDRPWDRPSARLREADRAWLLNQAGFILRALGRLPEAVQPLRAAVEACSVEKSWRPPAAPAT